MASDRALLRQLNIGPDSTSPVLGPVWTTGSRLAIDLLSGRLRSDIRATRSLYR